MVDLCSPERKMTVLAGSRVCKKYRKRLWKRECRNLKSILPSIAKKRVSDVEVIEHAVNYIETLEKAIAERLGVIPCPQMIAALHMQHFMKGASQSGNTAVSAIQNQMPSQSQSPLASAQRLTHIHGYNTMSKNTGSVLRQ